MAAVRIAMVAGEASSDQLAAHLIAALKAHLPDAQFYGIGGPRMQREGFEVLWPSEKLAVRGYAEVIRHYREITGIRRQLLSRLTADRPHVFIGVDGSDFNLWLERRLKRRGITAIHFVSPSIWAWRKGRMKRIVQSVSHILALYPFEPELYRETTVKVSYVGHPIADMIPLECDQHAMRERLDLAQDKPVIAILPGSRQAELHFMADTFIATAKLLLARFPSLQFLVPLVSRETREQFEAALWNAQAETLPFKLMFGHAQDAMVACDAALVASGTATLETALHRKPMVIAYKMSPWSWRLMRGMRYLPWIGLPNILSGRYVVPEFLQDEANPENLAQALGNLLTDRQARAGIERVFGAVHRQLRQDTAAKAAAAVLPYLETAAAT